MPESCVAGGVACTECGSPASEEGCEGRETGAYDADEGFAAGPDEKFAIAQVRSVDVITV
jgi:hypothetical protein